MKTYTVEFTEQEISELLALLSIAAVTTNESGEKAAGELVTKLLLAYTRPDMTGSTNDERGTDTQPTLDER